jgi:hypothetical protein
MLAQLYAGRADASRSSDDQKLLPSLEFSQIPEVMQCGAGTKGNSNGIPPVQRTRFIANAAFSWRHAYWACPPPAMPVEPKTRSPALNLTTSLPSPTIFPANSVPRIRSFQGLPGPNISLAIGSMDLVTNVKSRMLQSPVDTVVVCTFMRSSLSFGVGLAISSSRRRSGEPYRACRMAFKLACGHRASTATCATDQAAPA